MRPRFPQVEALHVETGNESHRFLHAGSLVKRRIKARERARKADRQPLPEADI